jgi:hypothetical protein
MFGGDDPTGDMVAKLEKATCVGSQWRNRPILRLVFFISFLIILQLGRF